MTMEVKQADKSYNIVMIVTVWYLFSTEVD